MSTHAVAEPATLTPDGRAALAAILRRDRNRRGYRPTVDHVRPRSRGGPDIWQNLIACGGACTTGKAGRTPDEAGARLFGEPRAPVRLAREQRRLWQPLATRPRKEASR